MQCDRGFTTLSPLGTRTMQTFKKLPKNSPTTKPINSNVPSKGFTPEVYVRIDRTQMMQNVHHLCYGME